jgi:O-antigen chain-terminating methyltransferase
MPTATSFKFDSNALAAPGTTERSVEIPWALSHYAGQARVLEVGCSFAYENPEYVKGLKALKIPELHGIDISSVPAPDFIKRTADIRASGYPPDFSDLIFCISTIEHVGRDNARHYSPVSELPPEEEPDRTALVEMLRIAKPAGKILLSVPFGRFEDHGWFINYDAGNISRLFRGLAKHEAYFKYTSTGWGPCDPAELAQTGYGQNGAPAAAGLGCFEIIKA